MRPLDGTTVVSLEHAIAAPFCTPQLADLGARVIKVERPRVGDFARAYDERVRCRPSDASTFAPRMDPAPALGQHTDACWPSSAGRKPGSPACTGSVRSEASVLGRRGLCTR